MGALRNALNGVLAGFGYRIAKIGRNDMSAVTELRQRLGAYVEEQTHGMVLGGPFEGMKLPPVDAWGGNDRSPRLLGTYEADLHAALETEIARAPGWVLNVGAADGYYAVGLARRLPNAKIVAYDLLPAALEATRQAAVRNAVEARFRFEGGFGPKSLPALAPGERAFVFMDCEGCEVALCESIPLPAFANISLLIESHDFIVPGIGDRLVAHFAPTHVGVKIREAGRDPNRFAMLQKFGSFERWLAVTEDRPETMDWVWLVPRAWPSPATAA